MILGDLLGRGIFNVDEDTWKFQRKLASLELGSILIRSFAFEIVTTEIKRRLVPLLSWTAGKGRVLDLQDVFRRFTFDNICRFSFGLDPGCLELSLPISEFAMAFDLASRLLAQRALSLSPLIWKIKRLLNLGSEKKLKKAIQLINVLTKEVIRQGRIQSTSSRCDNYDRRYSYTRASVSVRRARERRERRRGRTRG
ncbi:PREDICTED: cytochrome P450 94C1-like [Nelumbo nucifera]|uniref:Cytochrome P450 94C1-like n=2 Tax=Nelumbo nucifera TaxID=4432 RepID=A0A822YQF8_NELNU|nr:PREDICTED: cytochrome P450 94C1-like [Nelumbo nucifera]DAD34822.1 TPA_asm: hypothetical protein HUJ06_005462 [Nelumbo nucifera]